MDRITLPYGKGSIDVDLRALPAAQLLDKHCRTAKTAAEIIAAALDHPIGTPRLEEIVQAGEKVVIVISDITRYYQRMDFYLPQIIARLEKAGVADRDITFLCANGAHDLQSQEEKDLLLGPALAGRFTLLEHDCRDQTNLVAFGVSKNGTPITINKLAAEADKLIVTGALSYHDMAGYGGGRKSILPGIASYESVCANHLQVFAKERAGLHPACRLGNIAGNPMHEDMMEACEFVRPDFLFNVILDSSGDYYQAVCGHYEEAFAAGVQYLNEACALPIEEKADLVIASCGGYPKDMNLYQASKAFSSACEAAHEGAAIIIVAACADGMGASESVDAIADFDSHEEREAAMCREFAPEAYSGYLICELARHYRFFLVTDYPDLTELAKSGVRCYRTLDRAIAEATAGMSPASRTYVIPHAVSLLPVRQTCAIIKSRETIDNTP